MVEPKNTDWARLAALIDGEGCIRIKAGKSAEVDRRNPRYDCWVHVANTDLRLLHWCKTTFGGYVQPVNPGSDKRRPTFTWYVRQKQAEVVLRNCLEFLIVKRERAELALAFRETFKFETRRGVPKELLDSRESFRQSMKVLNMRGPKQVAGAQVA